MLATGDKRMETYMVRLYTGPLSADNEFVSVEAEKSTVAADIVKMATRKLKLGNTENYELAEVFCSAGQLCKERCVEESENPVRIQLLWPKVINTESDCNQGLITDYRFYIRKKDVENSSQTLLWMDYKHPSPIDNFLTTFLRQPTSDKEYPDLCNLPDLNERTLLENIKGRFVNGNIYTYVGSILIAVNPFKFFPIYNPKYVKMYQYKWLGDLPPHIFAIADAAYSTMLRTKKNQCIVISGESGSGKTESTNLLLHHLTALSQKGNHASGVEQTILGAGPVLEAFGNAKTVHNNNSSRFGKFIQVNYKEYGMVHGAIVEKYLLEKSRIVSQAKNERNYHVFYYLLKGTTAEEAAGLYLSHPEDYYYLSQSNCYTVEGVDEDHEFARLKQSMEMVGFSTERQKRIFSVLSAVLHLGNVEFKKKGELHHDESVVVKDEHTINVISSLLKVKEKTLIEALTQKKTTAGDETFVMNYKMEDAIATRDAMAKCLYGALFDWIVLKVNHALLAKRHNSEHQGLSNETQLDTIAVMIFQPGFIISPGNSIGVLDIFGFEDFTKNSFEQFCINYANEHLQYYFNQHIFKLEQEEYKREGIQWKNIEFIDNTGCLELFYKKPNGLFCLLDEECNFPGATNDTLLSKFNKLHERNLYYEVPQVREGAFVVVHYAGKVKYRTVDFREKNSDLIRTDIVGVLKNSNSAFVKELTGVDPVAVLRWAIVRTFFRCVAAFIAAGQQYREKGRKREKLVKKDVDAVNHEGSAIPNENFLSMYQQPGGDVSILSGHGPSNLHGHLTACSTANCTDADEMFWKMHGGFLSNPLFPEADAYVMRKATRVIMKNKSFKPRTKSTVSYRDIKTLKTIAARTMFSGGRLLLKKQPPSVSAQFQWSLSRLMETLNQGNPFFVRCIKSNSDKAPCQFDDELVLRQLHYTGMLATVKIRQSGYNYRLTFEEFIQLYKILLRKGLLSSKEDVKIFLESMDLNKENYQIGITKVFLRETEKVRLDESLHWAIMQRVVKIQQWMKSILERQAFLRLRCATIKIQKHARKFIAQRKLCQLKAERDAAILLQAWFQMVRCKNQFAMIKVAITHLQAIVRGFLSRKRVAKMLAEMKQKKAEEILANQQQLEHLDMQSSTSDEGVLTKGSSAEELEVERDFCAVQRHDSEESSGILEDSESETLSMEARSHGDSITSLPVTPTTPGSSNSAFLPDNSNSVFPEKRPLSKVQEMARAFQRRSESAIEYFERLDLKPTVTKSRSADISDGGQKENLKRKMKAPLAKQESLSDLEISPNGGQTDKNFGTGYEKPLHNLEGNNEKGAHRSPFRRARKHIKNIMGDLKEAKTCNASYHFIRHTRSTIQVFKEKSGRKSGKKDSVLEDSDDSQSDEFQLRRPQDFGVEVLPALPDNDQLLSPGSNVVPPPAHRPHAIQVPIVIDGKGRKKHRRTIRKATSDGKTSPTKWNVAGTSQWQYSVELTVTDYNELLLLDEFIYRKLVDMSQDCGRRDTICDVVFKKALKEFHRDLKASMSVEIEKKEVLVKYRDLMTNFEQVLRAQVKNEGTNAFFPVTMGVNAFRGFLDEFMKESKKRDRKEEKKYDVKTLKRHKKDVVEHIGHKFLTVQFNIPTFCELCLSTIWIIEKGYVCQVCKYACHKKCCIKSTVACKGIADIQAFQEFPEHKVFGVPLQSLVYGGRKVPEVADILITKIELHGLYTVGVYRKCGAAAKVKQLKQMIDIDFNSVDFDECPVHVLTTTLKYFFRELPEPVLTFDLYDDFLQAAETKDEVESVQAIFAITERLPKINYDLFERLIFHLARIAYHEKSNKMSANGLAIIFAPCLLRANRQMQAQESLNQVPKQTQCIEYIIAEQVRKMKITLADISTLETAKATASDRLSHVRASIKHPNVVEKLVIESIGISNAQDVSAARAEERALSAHIESIQKEKEDLTSKMPRLECHLNSDDETFDGDIDHTMDPSNDSEEEQEEYAVTFDLPVNPPSQLVHLTKRRATIPSKKRPKRYKPTVDYKNHSSVGIIVAEADPQQTQNMLLSLEENQNNDDETMV